MFSTHVEILLHVSTVWLQKILQILVLEGIEPDQEKNLLLNANIQYLEQEIQYSIDCLWEGEAENYHCLLDVFLCSCCLLQVTEGRLSGYMELLFSHRIGGVVVYIIIKKNSQAKSSIFHFVCLCLTNSGRVSQGL